MQERIISIVLNNFKNDSRVLKECISLQRAGYDVKVIALHEGLLEEFEEFQGISVHRIKLKTRNWSKYKLVQLVKYLEFIIIVINKYKNSSIIHCNDLNALPVGVIIKKIFNKKIKVIYDAHEYEAEVNGLSGFQKKLTIWLEKKLIKFADQVITVSDGIADEYARIYGIKKPAVVLNAPPYKLIKKKDKFRENFDISSQQMIFLYQGGLSKGRGIEIILETFKLQWNRNKEQTDFPIVVFMGYGPLETLIKQASQEYGNIYFHQAVSLDVLLDYTSSADYGILFYENNCLNHFFCSPNKMFEYMMAEIPVIASNLYEIKRLVHTNRVGVVAHENTSEGLSVAIREAIQINRGDLNENIKLLNLVYNWENQEKILLKVYEDLKNVRD